MSDNKKYYYLKLKENFFDTEDMKLLQAMIDGYLYSDILLKLYLQSLRQGGRLMYRGIVPYTPDMIATITHHQIGTVEKAMKILEQMGFVEILDNGAIYMLDIQNFIGQSSNEADRQRLYRNTINAEKNKLIENMSMTNDVTNVTTNDVRTFDKNTPEIRDKSIENKDKENINILAQSSDGQTSKLEADTEASVAGHVRPSPKAGAGRQSNEVLYGADSEQEADVEALILNDGSEWRPTQALFAEYVRLYPNVDVKQQFNVMRGWCISNPSKRKTRRGITRFVNGWLSRAQDKGGISHIGINAQTKNENRFNSFPKQNYDFAEIESALVANNSEGGVE